MSSFRERVLRLIDRERLIPAQGRVLVALSGGADSVALTVLVHELAATLGCIFAGVVHLNHQLRRTADDDERFCRELAEQLSVHIEVGRSDVRGRAEEEGISIEEAGHRARYAFFERTLHDLDADCVATAHTRDDQAETYLMRLIRGAGPEGLAGIRPRSGCVIRPLLDVSRSELRAYLEERHISFREDETNRDVRITRNRVRHELIPLLEQRFSPAIVKVLARDAAIARGDAEWLDAAANRIAAAIVTDDKEGVTVDAAALGREPTALARRLAKAALERVARRPVGFNDVERFLDLAQVPPRDAVAADFPGCRVERHSGRLIVTKARPRGGTAGVAAGFAYPLPIPGEVQVPEAGLAISAARVPVGDSPRDKLLARGPTVAVAAGLLSDELIVRSWRPGDVVKPLGLGGSKKLQDFFVDRKVAWAARQKVPIVTDKQQGIVWVVGHTVAEDFRVTAGTTGVLILKVRKLGGAG